MIMVSNLYSAGTFYKEQKAGKIAKGMNSHKKLIKGSSGYYLNKKHTNGVAYKQKVNANDMVYSRASGVTKYSASRDKGIKHLEKAKVGGSAKAHSNKKHMSDRVSSNRTKVYI